mmetsp:Transcript_21571/g.48503  ORF Transcript_21571/g.48503 Transcript_21571/m.48503 type:complete len:109 (+) Transcript_21571:209-535(+)
MVASTRLTREDDMYIGRDSPVVGRLSRNSLQSSSVGGVRLLDSVPPKTNQPTVLVLRGDAERRSQGAERSDRRLDGAIGDRSDPIRFDCFAPAHRAFRHQPTAETKQR